MDCQIDRTSTLPQIWAIETLACSNQVDLSLLLDLLEKTPEISNDIGRNAREWVSLKILERLFIQGARANLDCSKMIRLDPSDRCEDVLGQILSETSLSHLKSAGTEMSRWDLEPFIKHKRSNLPKCALKQLKDAILEGSHSISASLKEKSGLSVGNQAELEVPVEDANCNGITLRGEGNDTNDGFPEPDENLVRVNRKRRATSERPAGELCTAYIDSVKKYKHDSICTDLYEGGKLLSAGVDGQIADMPMVSERHIKGKGIDLGRKIHVGSMKLNEPSKDDDNGCTSKGFVGPEEVLSCGKEVANCDAELNNKPKEQGPNQNIEETKGDKNELCDLKRTYDQGGKSEQNIQIVEVEELVQISTDNDGNNDDRTDIAQKENASFSLQCTHSQNIQYLTNCRDYNLLDGTSKIYTGKERCSIKEKTRVEVMGENGPPGDQCTSKGLVKNDVGSDEKQAPHCDAELLTENFDESAQYSKGENTNNGVKGFDGPTTMNRGMYKFDRNVIRAVPTVSEADEDVDKSSDNDGYHDEKTSIDTKKKIFLSSQCTYSQDSMSTIDRRELHHCIKCNKGGKLLSCSSNSCALVVHESCLGSDAAFDRTGKFYCPFCAYSQAITEYMEVKKKASQGRKDLAAFICLGPQEDSKRHSQRSCWIGGKHLEHNDGSKSNEHRGETFAEKVSHHQRRKTLEYEQAERPELRSGCSPPFGGDIVGSTDRLSQSLNKYKQDVESMREESQSLNVHGRQQLDALTVCNSHGGTTRPSQASETSKSEECADVRSKRGVSYPPETELPCENKCPQRSESADAEESSKEDNENSGASKYFIRVRKLERETLCPEIPQLRRKRLPWTSEEEEKLKEGVRSLCGPHEVTMPWKRILKFGDGVFQPSRSTMDLKDKWRNMCKASPKPK